MRKITFLLSFLTLSIIGAQTSWKKISSKNLVFKGEQLLERDTKPEKFDLFNLELDNFKNELTLKSRGSNKTIDLPDYNGNITKYQIIESSNFTEPVDKKYGLITSYNVVNINDKTETGKLSVGIDGVHITLYSTKRPTHYIDPYTKNNRTYISYNRSDIKKSNNHFECQVIKDSEEVIKSKNLTNRITNDGNLRSFRLALSSTGEYSQFHINRQGLSTASEEQRRAAVLSAMNTTMARVNGIFERDLSVRMNIVLVGGNNPLIFLDPNTDNLENNDSLALIRENQTLCDNIIGSSNYDLGHIFATGNGGIANLGSVCNDRFKAGAMTGWNSPLDDPFDVDFVAHEIGHQFGGNHTFNGNQGSCAGTNRNDNTAVEPGSGTTIMGYAGICSPQNVQTNSDDYFHTISISEMLSRIQDSGSCASLTPNGNTSPTSNAGSDYIVPRNTPLVLRGSGNDADGNTGLTYCWEQIDNEIVVGAIPPNSSSQFGAQFRSLSPKSSPNRYLPELSTVLTNSTSSEWQVLPNVAREMNFALTVRDNQTGGGGTARDDMKITITNAEPFTVTSQNTSVTWSAGSTQTITWNKSTTDQAPINCQNVRILLSTNGGLTFPIVLADNTPNDGSHNITVPNNITNSARIIVEAVDNIFYNVNSTNFSIISNIPTFVLNNTTSKQIACNSGNPSVEYNLEIDFINGFNETVSFNATNLPIGANAIFTPNTINGDGTLKMVVSNLNGVTANSYNININATSTSVNRSVNAELEISDGTFSNFSLTTPSNNTNNTSIVPDFTWESISQAESYDIQIATDNSFANIVINDNSNTNSYSITSPLDGLTQYFWRVRGKNSCGTGNFTNTFSFTTENPMYCSSTFTDEAGGNEHITNVTFNTINNTSGNDTTDGYIDYTSISTNVNAGDTHQISVTFDPVGFQDHCYVFIDWNQDFNFDISTERYDLGSLSGGSGTATSNITIPNNAINGNTRMRVIIQYFDGTNFALTNGACDSDHASEWGETEDYTINVINNTASVEDFKFDNFSLYPNPSKGVFNISFEVLNTEKVNLKIFDFRGRLVENLQYKNIANKFSEELDLEKLNSGVYLLQIQNGVKQTTKKLIIK
ncbi:reprolysin-like metallopeptidase [uncultured Tenacibaculum sp.]|uniref:reprolysin-like metallopeptidase n=1 Tax=uncultured Tenacibaculum sp. TaxID=174713 RepID=UPI0026207D19|nr:zinc-dependent metalloprotease family protein [uncultured Tenacibaculum sp.]